MFETPETIVVNQAGFYGDSRATWRASAPRNICKQLQLWDKRDEHVARALRRHEAAADDRAGAHARAAAADSR